MKTDINKLKKQIIFRCTFTGTKETDIVFRKTFIKNIDNFSYSELNLTIKIFINLNDIEIYNILIGKNKSPQNYEKIFNKFKNV
tara:strand:+ start:396 stop:647 length:252 start_codon:yes stop_codon:yes gene_type:complete